MKRCQTCQRVKPLTEFYYRAHNNTYFKSCIPCRAKNVAEQKRKIYDWVDKYKEKKGCCECGIKDKRCLQLHHRDRDDKKSSVAQLIGKGYIFKTVKVEVEKCDVICANCHSIHHYDERRSGEWGAGKYTESIIEEDCVPIVEQLELFLNFSEEDFE